MDQHFEYYDFGKNHAPRKVIKSGYKKEVKKCNQCEYGCSIKHRKFENSFENTQWRKVKRVQPM